MKKTLLILSAIVLFFAGCKKDDILEEGEVLYKFAVTTNNITDITLTTAQCGGYVSLTSVDGLKVTARGICWNTKPNPTINDNKTTNGSGTGTFTSQLSNLVPQTTYYVKAYATNENGTAYGEVKTFKTKPEETICEPDGKIDGYDYVDLGLPSGLKWATCNVGADSFEDYGDYYAWGEIEEPSPAEGYVQATCGTYNKRMNDISGHETYDAATANWGGVWRMPSKAECEELMNANYCTWSWIEQNGVKGYLVTSKINGNYIFLPAAGSYDSGGGVFINERGSYWTSTPTTIEENQKAYYLVFLSTNKIVGSNYRENGRVVRPVTGGDFENPAAQYAEVTTAEVSGITISTAVCGGNVTVDKYSEVRERGVCYSTSENPTISDNIKSATPASGAYTVELTGLQMNTTYYVRAYATTDAGISYGEVKSFTTANIGVITSDVTNVTTSTAVCGGEVIANSEITFRGIYWGTSADFIHNIMMYPATDGAEYTVELTGLKPNTTYYVKAYATFNNNEYYGEVKSFTTLDYEYVDLGLPSGTLWATQNVGATTPQEKGNSYKWGATEVGGASYNGFEDISGTQYDAATANWNSDWRMPTREQMIELHEKCTWEYEGTGYRVIGPNKNEIFLPNTEPVHIIEGYYSCYWTSQPISPGSVALRFNNGIHELTIVSKDNACAIRPVRSK